MIRHACLIGPVAALLVCGSGVLSACAPAIDAESCELGVATFAVQAADRKLLGQAADYPADGAVRGQEQALYTSQRARRALAWRTVGKLLAPVPLAEFLPDLPDGVPAEIPRWHTFYGRDDLQRMFLHLYQDLGPERRAARARFADSDLDLAMAWNVDVVDGLENWPEERWLEYLHAVDSTTEVSGIGGIGRVAYSPAAARHFLASYPDIVDCQDGGIPGPFATGDGSGERRVARELLALAPCGARSFGPYFVAAGENLRATIVGDSPGLDVVGYRENEPVECRAQAGEPCLVAGPGAVTLTVVADGREPGDAALEVDYTEARPDWAPCLASEFPFDAVLIKADWHRAQLGFQLPVYDTSADALVRRRAPGTFDWGEPDGLADPGPDEIYTVTLNNGNIYRLAGLHIMTKELDHWLWITLFWSADPDSDFGADRPADIPALSGPFGNYKMCVTTAFTEGDSDPTGGFATSAPSLADALAVVHGGQGAPTWCSNPYLELGPGNAASNCIGCHQHGGTGVLSETILGDPRTYPAHGRTQVRNNFPADYSWAVDSGDRLGRTFADVVEYYDSFEAAR